MTTMGVQPQAWLGSRDARHDSLRALAASIGVHLILVLALVVSLNWSTEPREPVQAELWSSLPPEKPAPRVTPKSAPEPAPEPKPDPAIRDAEIALAKKKKAEQEAQQKAEAERQAKLKQEKELAAKEKAAREKAAKEKMAKDKAAKQKADEDKAQQEKAAAKRLAEQREAELARLGLDAKAKPQAKGKDSQTKAGVASGVDQGARSGREAEWIDKVKASIRGRVRYGGADTSDMTLSISLLPTGQITSIQKKKGSNSAAYDAAVLRALESISKLPKPPDGVREITIDLRHRN
ncbi:MAG: cell envelope integrity protein TolA [Burkholderiaceae bacterium]